MTTPLQEMFKAFISEEAISKVKAQAKSGEQIVSVDMFDMNFRIFKTNVGMYNFELLCNSALGMYFKPIGFYSIEKGFLSRKVFLTVLKEFESELQSTSKDVSTLSLIENAVIAAFSMEVVNIAQQYKDANLMANGLKCDIFMSFDNIPQFYLDDQYNVQGCIAMYPIKQQNSVNPTVQTKALFDKFQKMELLSVFKRI